MKKLSMEELQRKSVDEFKEAKKSKLRLVLDDIRSMSNIGSVFRTSDAFLVEKIHLCGITAQPPHREIEKTAIGATESVAWSYHENVLELIKELKSEGFIILSLEQADKSVMLNEFLPKAEEKYAVVLGNEVFGVNEEIIGLSDQVIEIPQYGTKHSLNVSVSAGILIWDFYSKINGKVLESPL
jgi:23S rRNA (guanosine2251-2'-O)-methyltransferase